MSAFISSYGVTGMEVEGLWQGGGITSTGGGASKRGSGLYMVLRYCWDGDQLLIVC